MGFTLSTLLFFGGLAVVYAWLPAARRSQILLIMSVLMVYALQPYVPIRWLDFWFPTLSIGLAIMGWYVTRSEHQPTTGKDHRTLLLVISLIVLLSLLRFVPSDYRLLVSSRPPPFSYVIALLSVLLLFSVLSRRMRSNWRWITALLILIGLFIGLKFVPLAETISAGLRSLGGQDVSLASAVDLRWLGFSYLAFRLIHTVRDRQLGLLPDLSLETYLNYIIFFPAYIAGPIDRAERFQQDIEALHRIRRFDAERFVVGLTRILIGVFKKFVIADTLAQGMALDPTSAALATDRFGLWLLLYGYALRLFFDFSGYTDMAIGVGILFGIQLPENFKQPYTRTSITAFWQSWHVTLSDWVRHYVFSPLSRHLLRRKPRPSPLLIVFIAQLATMIVIGLWHGITVPFLIWGIWHGIGLFIHKVWTDRTRGWYRVQKERPFLMLIHDIVAWFITFHFVVLGWVWFALSNWQLALDVFAKLFGVNI